MLVGERSPEGRRPNPRGLLLAVLFGLLLFVTGTIGIVTTVANAAAPALGLQVTGNRLQVEEDQPSNLQTFKPSNPNMAVDTPTPVCIQYTTATSAATMIPGVNNHIGNDCDDCSTLVNLPFSVTVYGTVYTSANLGSNGHIQFASNYQGSYSRQCLPVSVFPPFASTLFAYYEDFITDQTPMDGIYTATLGTAPNRQFVVRWNANYFNHSGEANFQVVFTEGSQTISVIYGTSDNSGVEASAGIQLDSSSFTQLACNAPALTNGLRVDYIPGACVIPPTNTRTPTPTGTAPPTATPCGPGSIIAEVEPNNTLTTSMLLPTTSGLQVFSSINPSADVDWFRFQANAGDRIWAYVYTLNSNTSNDSVLSLRNASDVELQYDDDNGSQGDRSSAIAGAYITQTGTYYLRVNEFDNIPLITPYTLYINRTSSAPVPEVEPNGTIATGNPYTISTIVTGTIAITDDLDVFTFQANDGDKVVFQVDGDPERDGTELNPDLEVINAGGGVLQVVNNESTVDPREITSENLVFTFSTGGPPTGTWSIRIRSEGFFTTGTYHFHAYKQLKLLCGDPPTATPTRTRTPTRTATATPVCPNSWSQQTIYPVNIMDNATVAHGGMVFSFGGIGNGVRTAAAYKYDTGGGAWTAIAPLPAIRQGASAVGDGTFIYILGGADGSGAATNTLYRYDPGTDTYTTLSPFTTPTWGHASAFLNGKIYRIGGFTSPSANSQTATVEVYTVSSGTWAAAASYPVANALLMAAALNGYVYAAGGISTDAFSPDVPLDTAGAYRYDPATNTWNDAAITDLPAVRYGAASGVTSAGRWILAGGLVGSAIGSSVIEWNPTANAWLALDPLPRARFRMGGAVVGSSLYVIGGHGPTDAGPYVGNRDNQRYTNTCAASVIGHVTWEGRPPQPNSLQQVTATLTLKSGANQTTYVAVTDVSGFFTVTTNMPAGIYSWWVKGPKWIANAGTLNITLGSTTQQEMGTLKTGDADNDNTVEVVDFSLLKGTFGRSLGDPLYDDRPDFNGDQTVDVTDFSLLKVNFGLAGAPPP